MSDLDSNLVAIGEQIGAWTAPAPVPLEVLAAPDSTAAIRVAFEMLRGLREALRMSLGTLVDQRIEIDRLRESHGRVLDAYRRLREQACRDGGGQE